jgi:hypothetical protein
MLIPLEQHQQLCSEPSRTGYNTQTEQQIYRHIDIIMNDGSFISDYKCCAVEIMWCS